MNLTLGKKIGGGFSLILLLTVVVGFVAVRAMREGVTVSGYIASDRVPRLAEYGDLQSNLLLTAYNTRIYFESADAKALETGMEYLNRLKANVARLNELNAVQYFENTANFLEQFGKGISAYEQAINSGVKLTDEISGTTVKLIESGNVVLGKLEGLVRTMSGTQRAFLDAGDIRNVAVYAQNMADTNAIYARVAMVLEKLLIAERNQDMKLLDDVRASLPGIDKDAQAVRSHLARQECRDLFDNAAAIWKEFSGLADRLASLQQENAKTSRARIDLYMGLIQSGCGHDGADHQKYHGNRQWRGDDHVVIHHCGDGAARRGSGAGSGAVRADHPHGGGAAGKDPDVCPGRGRRRSGQNAGCAQQG